jgi:hypothetical protein
MKSLSAIGVATTAAFLGVGLAACGSSSPSATSATTAPRPTSSRSPAAAPTSESNCTVDCTNPIASTGAAWLAQEQAPLSNIKNDLAQISSDESSNPADLTLDGSQLAADAQAALNDDQNGDPAPTDNAGFVTAMSYFISAGNDYTGDNASGQQNISQADVEVQEGISDLNSFGSASGIGLSS